MPVLLLLYLFSSFASAQTYTVLGDRLELPANQSTSSSVVITKEEMATKSTINDVLADVAGMNLAENGAYGGSTTYFMRGFGRGGVKVFIDGIEVVDPSDIDRGLQLQHFPLAGVERIEVLKGAQGALYGADASGGVILITTSKDTKSNVRAGYASHETWSGGFQTSAKQNDFILRASGDLITSEGISAYNQARIGPNAEKDPYQRRALNVGVEHTPSKTRLNVRAVSAKQDIDNSFTGDVRDNDLSRYDHQIYTLSNQNDFAAGEWTLKTSVAHSKVERDVTNDHFEGNTNQVHSELEWLASENHSLVFFGDYGRDEVDAASEFKDKSQDHIGAGLTHHWLYGKFFSDQSLRVDKSQAYAGRLNGRLGIGLNVTEVITTKLQVASGFKTPTLYQRFTSFGGNENLSANKTYSYSFATSFVFTNNSFEIATFFNDSSNQIDYDLTTSKYKNIGESESYGAEWSSRHKFDKLKVQTAFTWMRARNKITKKDLARRPRYFGNIRLDYSVMERLSVRGSHRFVSSREDSGKLPYYDVVALGTSWNHTDVLTFDFDIGNLFDRDYESVRGYGTLGRTFSVQARWQL